VVNDYLPNLGLRWPIDRVSRIKVQRTKGEANDISVGGMREQACRVRQLAFEV